MNFSNSFYDLPKILFNTIFIILMSIACFLVMQPFLIGLSWASIIVITTWPMLIKIQQILWNKRLLAIIVMVPYNMK